MDVECAEGNEERTRRGGGVYAVGDRKLVLMAMPEMWIGGFLLWHVVDWDRFRVRADW